MSDAETVPPPGAITVAPEALLTMAKLSALGVPGVADISPIPGGVNRWFTPSRAADGVRIEVKDATVAVDLYLVLNPDTNFREVGRAVQAEVARAIHEMVGMDVRCVNIYIEDVALLNRPTP